MQLIQGFSPEQEGAVELPRYMLMLDNKMVSKVKGFEKYAPLHGYRWAAEGSLEPSAEILSPKAAPLCRLLEVEVYLGSHMPSLGTALVHQEKIKKGELIILGSLGDLIQKVMVMALENIFIEKIELNSIYDVFYKVWLRYNHISIQWFDYDQSQMTKLGHNIMDYDITKNK